MTRLLVPNSTQIPDVIIDHWMAELSGAEFKVLLYIARRTYGFQKERDNISLTQIAEGIKRRDGTVLDRGTGISRRNVLRAVNTLEERGMVIRQTNLSDSGQEFEENTYSINLNWSPNSGSPGPGGTPEPGPGDRGPEPGQGVGTKCPQVGTKMMGGRDKKTLGVGTKCPLQETDIQHPVQETAAAGGADRPADAADASLLVQELVSHGVGKAAAEKLARTKPEACRRYLGYLPFVKVKKSKGAWLANAIRDEYGPPAGMTNQPGTRRLGPDTPSQEPRQGPESDLGRANLARLRVSYASLEKSQPEAITAFLRHLESEREKSRRVADLLSPERRAGYLASFDGEEKRLELFGRWLPSAGHPGVREEVAPATTLPTSSQVA